MLRTDPLKFYAQPGSKANLFLSRPAKTSITCATHLCSKRLGANQLKLHLSPFAPFIFISPCCTRLLFWPSAA